jgi:hypothetical protein
MKNVFLILIMSMVILEGLFTFRVYAQTPDNTYTVLAPLPCIGSDQDCNKTATQTELKDYLPGMFKLLIGLSAAFAVLMIVIGGFQYMSTDAIQGKSNGKERIKNAIFGLVLVIGAWLILATINPNLLSLNLNIEPVSTTANSAIGAGGSLTNIIDRNNVELNTTDQLLTQGQASAILTSNGFTFSSTGNCTDPTNASCTSVAGMHSDTVAGLVTLKTACGTACGQLVETAGTEVGHACGDPATCLSHASGFKADISNTQGNGAAFTNFISQQVQTQDKAQMTTNGFYNITVGGFNYQVHPEGDHMDITVIPK